MPGRSHLSVSLTVSGAKFVGGYQCKILDIYYWYILLVYTRKEAPKVQTAKLFMNGRSQAVRLPKGFRFEGEEVFVKKVGNAVVLLPSRGSWEALYESLPAFSGDFMEERGQPTREQERPEAPFG